MSTILNTNGDNLNIPVIKNPEGFRCAIVTASWNSGITHVLRDGAVDVLRKAGVEEEAIHLYDVPGTVELVKGAAWLTEKPEISAIIVIGCVIRGDTPHFDYVCQIAAQGTAALNCKEGGAPVIFGVLTVDNPGQAQERAGGALGNKGAEAAVAAIEMHNLRLSVSSL